MLERDVLLGLGDEVLDELVERGCGLRMGVFQPSESRIHTTPARRDELDQEREIVDASLALGEQLALDALETSNRLVEEASDLCDVPSDGKNLVAKSATEGVLDLSRECSTELGGGRRERFDLCPRPLKRRIQVDWVWTPFGDCCNALSHALEGRFIHRGRGYSHRRMDTSLLDYELPTELIAQSPVEPRDASRLLVYRASAGAIEHRRFSDLPDVLGGELAVVNDSRVVPGRMRLHRRSGGSVEVLLVERLDDGLWEGLARPSRRLRAGERLGPVELIEHLGGGRWVLRLEGEPAGEAPLPPYIHEQLRDENRYQTVYAREAGSAAAPTAGLHFTPGLLGRLDHVTVTLHIGLDTFRPVTSARLEDHAIHGERYSVEPDVWDRVERADRVLAVGTSAVRVLETVTRTGELRGRTTLFVTPGFEFRRVDALVTNFHLPHSTLLALVMAFAGIDVVREIYAVAIAEKYRFYSFGDAMLVL